MERSVPVLIGYMRAAKADGGRAFNLQRDALIGAGVPRGRSNEDHASNHRDGRPGSGARLKSLRQGDAMVTWKLDRLGRALRHLAGVVQDLTRRGVGLRVLAGDEVAIDTTTADGQITFGFFAAQAEFERKRIVERIKAGLASTPARGRTGGRPFKMAAAKLRLAPAAKDPAMGQPGAKVCEPCTELGITRQTLFRHVDSKGALRPERDRLLGRKRLIARSIAGPAQPIPDQGKAAEHE